MEENIQRLCEEYTELSEEEIQVIQMMARTLQPLSNLEAADIFLDCPCSEEDAIVVAEAKPEDAPSAYKSSVVGMFAKAINEPAVARTLKLGTATKYMKARTQEDNYTIQSVEPIKYKNKVIGVLIREKRIVDDESEESESLNEYVPINPILNENSWLTESIDDGLIFIDRSGYIIYRNAYAKKLFQDMGFLKEILGQRYRDICLTDYDEETEQSESITEIKYAKHYLRIRHIQMQEGNIRMAVIIRDITWDREQEKKLVLKSVAIKELHHRVKNNLQTIASLLRLQARRTESKEAEQVLHESINRVLSISATHQLLAQNGVDNVSLKEVLLTVKNNIAQQLVRSNGEITISMEGDDITVNSDIATSVALTVNELLQNSIKYAFTDREQGNIWIILKKGKIYSTISVVDDGIGFDIIKRKHESLGLNIVQSMVRDKLYGNLKIWSGKKGTKVLFDFVNEVADMMDIME